MIEFKTIDDVLNFAINSEQEAVDFYTDLASKTSNKGMQETFEQFAQEERGHKSKLERIKQGNTIELSTDKVLDLKIGDYLVDIEVSENMSYQDALILAMKREKSAFKLYTNLSNLVKDQNICDLFRSLAQEEAKHKLRFEVEYDDNILAEN